MFDDYAWKPKIPIYYDKKMPKVHKKTFINLNRVLNSLFFKISDVRGYDEIKKI